jgi:Zn-dependent protease with chaperone function
LPDTARLVVSKGLFTYLDDDEAATVYAHELGHIVHWDFALMTLELYPGADHVFDLRLWAADLPRGRR